MMLTTEQLLSGIDKAIKQSGAVMLGYPLMWGLSQTNLDRNLQHYRAVLPDSSPSTAWSMLAINELENGKESLAQDAFHKSYKDYVKEPFKVDIDKKFTIANSPSQLVHLDFCTVTVILPL